MEVINGLLRIKRIRENSREGDMRRAKQQFELAAEALRRASELQEQRDRERADRERSLYDDVCARVVIVRDLDDLRYEVDVMKDAAKADAQAVVDAPRARHKPTQSLPLARNLRTGNSGASHQFRIESHATATCRKTLCRW